MADTATEQHPEEVLAELQAELAKHERESARHRKLVIIAWGGDLDRVWRTFILATTGAAMGMETTVFFTFWGLFSFVKNDVRIAKIIKAVAPIDAMITAFLRLRAKRTIKTTTVAKRHWNT